MTRARDLSKLLGTANNGVIPNSNLGVSFENISDTGTAGTKVALGTTNQRGSTAGQIRYNTTLGRFEATTNGSTFLGFASPPSISSISPSILNSAGGDTVIITGTNFVLGSTSVTLNNIAPSTVTVDSTTQITITGTPALNAQTYTNGLVVIADGASTTFTFSTSGVPAFTTASGSLGSFNEQTSVGTLIGGTDVGITHTISSGSLPSGVSINSANGNITGTIGANTNTALIPENGAGDTTSNFTVLATDAESQTASRNFSITNKQGDTKFDKTYWCYSNGAVTTNEAGANDKGTITNNNTSVITSQTSTKQFGSNALRWNGDGSTSHLDITVPNDKAFHQSGANYLCFEGWGYLDTNRGNQTWGSGGAYGNQGFIGVSDTYMSITIDGSGRVSFYQYGSDSQPYWNGQFSTQGNISTGVWFHFLFQFEPSVLKYWKDGVYIGAINRVGQNGGTPASYRIGGTVGTSGRQWRGYFDEVRLTISSSSNDARISGTSNFTVPTEGLRLFSS